MNLNTTFIRRRQRELGLSRRQLASGTGISGTRADQILDDKNHHSLTIANLTALAETLGCSVHDLLTPADQPNPAQRSSADTADLPATLGALLLTAPKAVSGSGLANATGHELEAVTEALRTLDRRLAHVGMAVRRDTNDGAYSIVPAASATTEQQQQTTLRAATARLDIDASTAKAVYGILSGTLTRRSLEASNDGRVTLGRLTNAGIIKPVDQRNAPLELADDVRQSLLLDVR